MLRAYGTSGHLNTPMPQLLPVHKKEDIPPEYRDTPIGRLLEYQNIHRVFDEYKHAELLVGMFMDNREHLHIPKNCAFIIRAGGANLRPAAFKVSYAIGVGGVKHIALIGHNDCGMVNLYSRREKFINGLVENAGWSVERATDHFMNLAPLFEIGNETEFLISEAHRLRREYPKIQVAPLLFKVEEGKLYLIEED